MSPSLPLPRGAALAAALGAAMVVAPLAAQQAPSGTFAVRCGKLLVGDGQQAITDAWLYVRDGKVERVSKTPPADDTRGAEATGKLMEQISQLIVHSLKAVQSVIVSYKNCFEVYGFDFIIDTGLRPWLLEVNLSPACGERTPWLTDMLDRMTDGLFDLLE